MPLVIGLIAAFCISLLLFFILPRRSRWAPLLVASYAFYMLWGVPFILVLVSSTLGNYLAARVIAHLQPSSSLRKPYLVAGIVFNLVLLFVFKYLSVVLSTLPGLLSLPEGALNLTILLPLGISFYTFKGLSYLLDVYQGTMKVENHIGLLAAYMAFLPQVIAGPIDRAGTLLPQIREPAPFEDSRAAEGFRLILWGAFKKLVLADRLAVYVNAVYDHPQGYSGWPLVLATGLFAFQVYADFSGYSDIAIGVARIFGIQTMENFRQPYFSQSVREFWQRWHISLSTWIRDYLFYPLARFSGQITRRQHPRLNQLATNLIVMGLVGLWHGANLTFVVWGMVHGLYLAVESWIGPSSRRLAGRVGIGQYAAAVSRMAVVFFLVGFAWIFFRANTLTDALYIASHLFAPTINQMAVGGVLSPFGIDYAFRFPVAIGALAMVITIDAIEARWGIHQQLEHWPILVRWLVYYLFQGSIVVLGLGVPRNFIYSRF